MTLLNVLKDCPYDKVIIIRKVFNSSGEEEEYGTAYAENIKDDGWCLYDGDDVHLADEVYGFYYQKNNFHILNLPQSEIELVFYTPITWTLYDGVKEKKIIMKTGYDAEVKRSTYGNN